MSTIMEQSEGSGLMMKQSTQDWISQDPLEDQNEYTAHIIIRGVLL
jgi:hypothetical protein